MRNKKYTSIIHLIMFNITQRAKESYEKENIYGSSLQIPTQCIDPFT